MERLIGRPRSSNPKNIRYSIRLDADTEAQLQDYCEKMSLTRGEAIRLGIRRLSISLERRLPHMKIYDMRDAQRGPRYIKKFSLETERHAQYCEAKFLMNVREILFSADLYHQGNVLYLDTPIKEATVKIGRFLRESIEACEDI